MTVGADIGVGLATSLITEVIRRPIDAFFAEARRRDHVSRPLTDKPSIRDEKKDELLNRLQSDLERIIGNSTGQYTQPVAVFIRELRSSVVLESIARAVLFGSDLGELRDAFKKFHGAFSDLPFSPDQLFDATVEACRSRIENVKDTALLDIVRAQHSHLSSQLSAIACAINKSLKDSSELSIEQYRDARLRVCRSIQSANKYISVETLRGPKRISLKSIALPSRLLQLDESNVEAAKLPSTSPTVGYLPFRRSLSRAVVLGDPGGGKTTLTQMLSYDLSNSVILDNTSPSLKQFDDRDLKVPLRVVLRQFEVRATRASSYSLLDHLREEVRNMLEGDERLANLFLMRALGAGDSIVIFDGLDEVLEVGARKRMVEQIEQFANLYPGCQILVTSRLVGYRDAPLNSEFMTIGLAQFNDDEIKKYSYKAIAAIERIKTAEAKTRGNLFFSQSSRVGRDIRVNPLMLGLMVQIFVYRGDVPGNRPEVYKECATLMFEKWDGRRDINVNIPNHLELLDVFGYVASRTFGDASSEEGVSREWLVSELRKHFEEWYIDRASASGAAKSLVEFLTGRAWVMSEVGPGIFKFTHRTFLEYFFARNLISQSKSIHDLINIDLLPRVINNQSSVVAHLALHMAVFRDGGKSRQAAETLEKLLGTSPLEGTQEIALLRFVVSAIPYLVIPEPSHARLIKSCVERGIKLGASDEISALSVLELLLSTTPHRRNLAEEELCQQIDSTLKEPDGSSFLFAMNTLGPTYRAPTLDPHFPRNRRPTELWSTLSPMRVSHQGKLYLLAKGDVNIARAYVHIYGEGRLEFLTTHGEEFLSAPVPESSLTSAEQLVLGAIFSSMETNPSYRALLPDADDCRAFLKHLMQGILTGGLSLHRLLIKSADKGHDRHQDAEAALVAIWSNAKMPRRRKELDPNQTAALVCLLSAFENSSDGQNEKRDTRHLSDAQRRSRESRYGNNFAPYDPLQKLCNIIDDQSAMEWVSSWLSRNYKAVRNAG